MKKLPRSFHFLVRLHPLPMLGGYLKSHFLRFLQLALMPCNECSPDANLDTRSLDHAFGVQFLFRLGISFGGCIWSMRVPH